MFAQLHGKNTNDVALF